MVPFELIKIRLQDKAQSGRYSGMIDCIQKIVRQEGLLAMYVHYIRTTHIDPTSQGRLLMSIQGIMV